MNPQLIFGVLIVLGLIWTGVWGWILTGSRQTVPYTEVAPRVTVLRRRLFYLILAVMIVVFLVSMRWLPYRPVRATTLGPPQVTAAAWWRPTCWRPWAALRPC